MYILHIETSTSICSVALSRGETMLACHDMKDGMNHSALLAPAIQSILASNEVKPKDLGAISVSSGPGSYTGLRVGTSTAKAMAYSLDIPLIAVSSLEAMARAVFNRHPEAQYALPMIDARRREVYTTLIEAGGKEVWPVVSVILDEMFFEAGLPLTGHIVGCGDGALKIGDLVDYNKNVAVDESIQCSASHLIGPALAQLKLGKVENPLHFVPYYMKPPNITQPKKAGMEPL